MKNGHIETLLYDYITGRLDDHKREVAEEHLKTCEQCKHDLAIMEKTLSVINSLD